MNNAASISLDLDDLWAYRRSFGLAVPEDLPSLLPVAIPRFLDFMAQRGVRGTVFVVGRDAEQPEHASLMRQIALAGHELGNHSHGHASDLETWSLDQQQTDLARAHAAIERAAGIAPVGFRAPSFQISGQLLEAIKTLGYQYDSSTFPSALGALARHWHIRRARHLGTQVSLTHAAYGSAAMRLPLKPYAWKLRGGSLIEVPITTLPGLRIPLHGTYLQFLADRSTMLAHSYVRLAIALCKRALIAPHYLLHATDFIGADDPFECSFLPGMQRPWRHKVRLLSTLVQRLQDRFTLLRIDHYVTALAAGGELPTRSPPAADPRHE